MSEIGTRGAWNPLADMLADVHPQMASLTEALQTAVTFQRALLEDIEADRPIDLDELVHATDRLSRVLEASRAVQRRLAREVAATGENHHVRLRHEPLVCRREEYPGSFL
jgi:hypothetical protein